MHKLFEGMCELVHTSAEYRIKLSQPGVPPGERVRLNHASQRRVPRAGGMEKSVWFAVSILRLVEHHRYRKQIISFTDLVDNHNPRLLAALSLAVVVSSMPMRQILVMGCARAAGGHVAAVPPSRVMRSR